MLGTLAYYLRAQGSKEAKVWFRLVWLSASGGCDPHMILIDTKVANGEP
jgi:hypothetical protein